MTLPIGAGAPDFAIAESRYFHDWRAGRWALLVAAKALSPTCSTEFLQLGELLPAFAACDVAVAALLSDPGRSVETWLDDLDDAFGFRPAWPIIVDEALAIAGAYALVDHTRTGLQRGLLLIDPQGTVAMALAYPVTTGRDFAEVLRVVRSVQLTASARVATPAEWQPGGRVMLPPSLSQEDAARKYPAGIEVVRSYLRYVAQQAT